MNMRKFFILTLVLMALAVVISPAKAVSLKSYAILDDSTIKVGDIFSDVDEGKAARVLGPAPLPGKDMTLNARTLMRIAIALDLPWRPATSGEHVTLSRAATIVKPDIIEDALITELQAKGLRGKFDLVPDRVIDDIILPQKEEAHFEISGLTIRHESGRFEATIYAPSQTNPLHRSQISGRIERLVDVPVLRETLRSGAIIGARDIDFIEMRESAVKDHMMLDADNIVGMTPRKMIMVGSPIKDTQVEYPQIVARGSLVTMILQNGNLKLTAQGKSLQNGAQGDMVRVVNASSKKTLEGRITGANEVTIESF